MTGEEKDDVDPEYVELCDDADLVSDWFKHDVQLVQGLIMQPGEIPKAPQLRK